MVKSLEKSSASSKGAGGVIVLAAGKGQRMKSDLPKVLQEISGKPLLFYILQKIQKLDPRLPIAVVVGHQKEKVEQAIRMDPDLKGLAVTFVHQKEQLGTGHAVQCAMDSTWGKSQVAQKSQVLVLPGDQPLLSEEVLQSLISPLKKTEALRLLTCVLSDPKGYGRIVRRSKKGPVLRIVEEKDATEKEKRIQEVGTSIYLFQSEFLAQSLKTLKNKNAQNEYYLTDVVRAASQKRKKMDVLIWDRPQELQGINDLWELDLAAQELRRSLIRQWAKKGVRFLHSETVSLDWTVELGAGVTIDSGAILRGRSKVGENSFVGAHVVLKDAVISENVTIKPGTVIEDSTVKANASLGPYAHLRPGSQVGEKCKIGNFVELKKSVIGESTSIAHLSYLGDAQVGRGVNIGCGFVTCNFDGREIDGKKKHSTVIEDQVFVGSDCQTVAPVKLGKGSYIASGSTITKDVEAGALAIARSRQVTKPGYANRIRENTAGGTPKENQSASLNSKTVEKG